MSFDTFPILYSFRRCPYAMRARLALRLAQQKVEIREVVLKDKPPQMIAISAKATVPVLQLHNANVIDQSIDIARWALEKNDPLETLPKGDKKNACDQLISTCDYEFKIWLDKYKYSDRHPEQSAEFYRQKAEHFLTQLEALLQDRAYLLDAKPTLADIAIMPFIRQFAMVDLPWFKNAPYPRLRQWLNDWLEGELFQGIMLKYEKWQEGQDVILL